MYARHQVEPKQIQTWRMQPTRAMTKSKNIIARSEQKIKDQLNMKREKYRMQSMESLCRNVVRAHQAMTDRRTKRYHVTHECNQAMTDHSNIRKTDMKIRHDTQQWKMIQHAWNRNSDKTLARIRYQVTLCQIELQNSKNKQKTYKDEKIDDIAN